MEEDDGEIEFLDEDAEIVHQCVQPVDEIPDQKVEIQVPVLVERRPVGRPRKKRKVEEEDSDYEPFKYIPQKSKKKKTQKVLRNTSVKSSKYESYGQSSQAEIRQYGPRKVIKKLQVAKDELLPRKHFDIRIPDYEDPLCLPVRAIKRDESDTKKLRTWNNLCLEHFERSDTAFRPETGETVSSKRTVILRNITNKLTGKPEITVWSKTTVENETNDQKSEVLQCVLPKYREKKVLNYSLIEMKRRRSYHHVDEAIITKEDLNDGERLIVYKPKETLSLVYKLFEKNNSDADENDEDDDTLKPYMKEVSSCRVCAPCYQVSWRGFRKNDKKIKCQICSKVYTSVYSLLSHLKSHSNDDMNKYKRIVSMALAQVVEYHYKCRICQRKFPGIKELRRHVLDHRGTETFICDIGSHVAT
ncbi:unnamed protein product, partial [Iphiclides podalirius]